MPQGMPSHLDVVCRVLFHCPQKKSGKRQEALLFSTVSLVYISGTFCYSSRASEPLKVAQVFILGHPQISDSSVRLKQKGVRSQTKSRQTRAKWLQSQKYLCHPHTKLCQTKRRHPHTKLCQTKRRHLHTNSCHTRC